MNSLWYTDLLHASAQKPQFPGEFQGNFRRDHGIRDVWLSNSVFSEFFRLFDGKIRSICLSARRKFFNSIFYQGYVILCDRNNFRSIFFALSRFVFTLFAFHVVSRTASEGLLLKFRYTSAFYFKKLKLHFLSMKQPFFQAV